MRLLKFEGTNAIGSAISLSIQLFLSATLSLSPVLGNIVGGVIGSAVAYVSVHFMSMRFVWRQGSNPAKN